MFIGREKELGIMRDALNKKGKHILLYGNRRVGKTTLANKAMSELKDIIIVNYECKKDTIKSNLISLEKQLYEQKVIAADMRFDSLFGLFGYLNGLNQRIVILIDEYPYLYYNEDEETVDSIFQVIIDKYANNLNIILSGSHIGFMKNLMEHSNPLFARFSVYLNLKEFNYLEASRFYENLSPYDKVAYYVIFGGSPFVLKQLDYTKGLEYNIKNTYLNETSSINMFASDGYTSDITTKETAKKIFEALGNTKLRYAKLEEKLGLEKNGLLNKQLKTLIDMQFINKNCPINKKNDNKKVTYYINNQMLRFYYNYIYGKTGLASRLGADAFYEQEIKDSLIGYIAKGFEDIARDFVFEAAKRGIIKDIQDVGTYYYDDAKQKINGEFDVAIEKKDSFDIIEVKYLKDKVTSDIVNKEIEQINRIAEIKIGKKGVISINGFESNIKGLTYMFDGKDLYFE